MDKKRGLSRILLASLLALCACGLFAAAASAGPLEASPTQVSFPQTVVGQASGAQTVTFTNSVPGEELVEVVAVGNGDDGDFAIVADGCDGTLVQEGESCEVSVAFEPQAGGSREAWLELKPQGMPLIVVPLQGQGLTKRLTVPATASFPLTSVGLATTQQIPLTNESEATVSISDVKVEGTDGADFSLEGNDCTGPLAPNQTCALTVRFAPSAAGERSAQLKVVSDATPGEDFIALAGASVLPDLSFEQGSLDLGLSEVHAGGAEGTLTLRNSGEAAVQLSNLETVGPDAGEFWISSSDCWGATLAPDQTCALQSHFNANEEGSFTAAVRVIASGISFEAPLSARAERPRVTPSAAALDFGAATLGTGAVRELTLTNDGNLPVAFFIAVVSGGDVASFQIVEESCTGRFIVPGESCVAQIRFDPASAGAKHATLSMFGGGEGALQVPLEGTGSAPRLGLSPSAHDFGAVAIGAIGPVQTLELRNESADAVAVDAVTLAGADVGDFGVRSDSCTEAVLGAGEACAVAVRFAPEGTGKKTATLRLRSAGGTVAASLSGEGLARTDAAVPDARGPRGRVALALDSKPVGRDGRLVIGRARCQSSEACVVRLTGVASGLAPGASAPHRLALPIATARVLVPAGASRALTTVVPDRLRAPAGARRLVVALSWRTGGGRGSVSRGFTIPEPERHHASARSSVS